MKDSLYFACPLFSVLFFIPFFISWNFIGMIYSNCHLDKFFVIVDAYA